jgi:hypothetical protein
MRGPAAAQGDGREITGPVGIRRSPCFLFGFLTLVALAYFWRRVPETKGRSLQEIERDLVWS